MIPVYNLGLLHAHTLARMCDFIYAKIYIHRHLTHIHTHTRKKRLMAVIQILQKKESIVFAKCYTELAINKLAHQ